MLLRHAFICFAANFQPVSRRVFKNTHFELQIPFSTEGIPVIFANGCGMWQKKNVFSKRGPAGAPGSVPVSPLTGWVT